MKYHIVAFCLGFLLDLLLGDPYWLPHPIRFMGSLIAKLEKGLWKSDEEQTRKGKFRSGVLLVVLVLGITLCVSASLLIGGYLIHPIVGIIMETIMTYQMLATKCLKVESRKVYDALKKGDLEEARRAVSMIVGRDTLTLDEVGVAKAAIETVAENTADGVIAPMLYMALGGPVLGFLYKAVNTMDSMIGYRNERYLYFGRAAVRLDDFMNFIPARVSAFLMIIAAYLPGGGFSGKDAFLIYGRDKKKHASPNSAQTESVCAGALGIQLAGDASYGGIVLSKPYIGDAKRAVVDSDIQRANCLLYRTAWLCEIACLLIMLARYR